MEARKILFVLNNSSSQKTIMSSAETLAQLKAEMRDANIDYANMTFYEGRTRTELKDDNSLLPTNIPVPAKGTTPASTTNELVFMLTTQNKKIRSGAMSAERAAAYEAIKANNLGDAVKAQFGKNFTQVSTGDLTAFLEAQNAPQAKVEAPKSKPSSIEANTASIEAAKAEPLQLGTGNISVIIIGTKDKLATIKVVKSFLHIGFKEAKDMVDGMPTTVNGLSAEAAQAFIVKLEESTATARILEPVPVQQAPVSDARVQKLIVVVAGLLSLLDEETVLDEDYSELREEAEALLNEEAPVVEEPVAETPKVKSQVASKPQEEKLSQAELDAMFGGWCK